MVITHDTYTATLEVERRLVVIEQDGQRIALCFCEDSDSAAPFNLTCLVGGWDVDEEAWAALERKLREAAPPLPLDPPAGETWDGICDFTLADGQADRVIA